uniref:Uncharacterized protein n=1 Tax=Panagrolaimus superbus TaxID=310955 RepID=A0A914XVP4_9BILA
MRDVFSIMDTVKKEEEIKAPKIPPGFEFAAAASETQKVDGNENDKIESKVTLMEYNDKDVGDGMQKVVESHIKIIAIEDYGNEDEEQKKLYSKINEVRRKSMDDKRAKENDKADNQMKDQQTSLPLIVITPPEEIKYESEEADDVGDSEESKQESFVIHQKEETDNSDDQIDETNASEVQDSIVEASETKVQEGHENQEEKIPAEIIQNNEKDNMRTEMDEFQDNKDPALAEVQSNEAVEIHGNPVESSLSFSCENAIADRYKDVAEKHEEQIENEGVRKEVFAHEEALLDSANSK